MLATYIHNLDPYFIQLWEGGPIRWYALSYVVGFSIGFFLIKRVLTVGRSTLSPDRTLDMVVFLAICILAGGRIGYVLFYRPDLLFSFHSGFPFWDVLAVHRGGMASHGGILGAVVGCFIFAWRQKQPTLFMLDLVAFGGPLGLFFGRIANFINGELYGRPVGERAIFSVKFPQELYDLPQDRMIELAQRVQDSRFPGMIDRDMLTGTVIRQIQSGNAQITEAVAPMLTARHPSQLYAAVCEGLIVFLVLLFVWRKPQRAGTIAGCFCMSYALLRIVNEFFRLPDAHIGLEWLGLSRGQWLSVPLFLLGFGLVLFAKYKAQPYVGGWRRQSVGS